LVQVARLCIRTVDDRDKQDGNEGKRKKGGLIDSSDEGRQLWVFRTQAANTRGRHDKDEEEEEEEESTDPFADMDMDLHNSVSPIFNGSLSFDERLVLSNAPLNSFTYQIMAAQHLVTPRLAPAATDFLALLLETKRDGVERSFRVIDGLKVR
jgi:hypothetical protein